MKNSKQLAKIFKALGEENRLEMLSNISKKEWQCLQGKCCGKDICIKDFSKPLTISFATISHHVKELVNAELITTKKEGRWVYCQINKSKIKEVKDFLEKISQKGGGGK